MSATRWQWSDYRYLKENLKWMLTHFDGPIAQCRMLRGRLRHLAHQCRQSGGKHSVRYVVYAMAYIECASPFDTLALALEAQALDCLLNGGIKPPKSKLSGLVAELFQARINAIKRTLATKGSANKTYAQLASAPGFEEDKLEQALTLYTLLCQYCLPTYPSCQPGTNVRVTPGDAIVPATDDLVRTVRRYRFSGAADQAKALAIQASTPELNGELILVHGQLKGALSPIMASRVCTLNQSQWDEWWLLAYAVPSRRWVTCLPEHSRVSPDVWAILQRIKGLYSYDIPLVKRLYHYGRFRLERRIDDPLMDTYVAAACLRWLFRSNQTAFARWEACRYQSLSLTVSRERTNDALGVMGDVLNRLFAD